MRKKKCGMLISNEKTEQGQ